MNCLVYYLDGFVRRFPLDKSEVTIGRGEGTDLTIDDEFLSREHLAVKVMDDSIRIRDLNSSNGTFVAGERVREASLTIGGSFSIGRVEFFLRAGSLDEFETAKELTPVFHCLRRDNETKVRTGKTRPESDLYLEALKTALKEGMGSLDFQAFVVRLSQILTGLWREGGIALLSEDGDDSRIHMLVVGGTGGLDTVKAAVAENPDVFKRDIPNRVLKGSGLGYQSCRFAAGGIAYALIGLFPASDRSEQQKLTEFFTILAQELKLLACLLGGDRLVPEAEPSAEAITVNIVAANTGMRRLIEQTRRFARSDLFILIQGESGTGKELFARLIHQHSRRAGGEFVALNCAAIPENLLESELFGYEKGAFTGASGQRKGKLEIASGGTLVLDEIGSMATDLQSKLLRALQEQEFYRLGGSKHIKVDLRIISITNGDLKAMVAAGRFRKDLYYRLVHRMIVIPPLRERRDDIPVLINHFTDKYCRLGRKRINGYTVKAYAALQDHDWDGNVRELENEIHSLVNLAEDGDAVGFDLLSDAIKANPHEGASPPMEIPARIDPQKEKEMLIGLLEANRWNKSETARKLHMTYRGLHEKLKRFGIRRPDQND
ncbi:MAG: sigma 54-interacting transcriptional regulator [Acidobacteriota bacterium]